jgi:hypothetical protein
MGIEGIQVGLEQSFLEVVPLSRRYESLDISRRSSIAQGAT